MLYTVTRISWIMNDDGYLTPCLKLSSDTHPYHILPDQDDVVNHPYLFAQIEISDTGVTIVTPGLKIKKAKRCPYCQEILVDVNGKLKCEHYNKASHNIRQYFEHCDFHDRETVRSLVNTYRIRSLIDIFHPNLEDELSSSYADIVDETIAVMRLKNEILSYRLDDFLFLFCPHIGRPSVMQIAQRCKGKLKNLILLLSDEKNYQASLKIPKTTSEIFYRWVDNPIHSKFLIQMLSLPLTNM